MTLTRRQMITHAAAVPAAVIVAATVPAAAVASAVAADRTTSENLPNVHEGQPLTAETLNRIINEINQLRSTK